MQFGIAGGGVNRIIFIGVKVQSAPRRNALRLRQQLAQQRRQRCIFRAANIKRQLYLAGDHVYRAARTAQGADGGDPLPALLTGGLLDKHHPFGSGGQRIFTLRHRHRARVSRLAAESAVQTARAINRRDHAQRQIRLFGQGPCSICSSR